jgi:hypothetical protein
MKNEGNSTAKEGTVTKKRLASTQNGEKKKVTAPKELTLTEKQLASMQNGAQEVQAIEAELQRSQTKQQEILGLILDAHGVGEATNVELKDDKLIVTL